MNNSAMSNIELGRRIKQLRLSQGFTLKDIESKVGVSATHVSEIERGKTSPTVGALSRIAEALEVNPSFLVDLPVGDGCLPHPGRAARPAGGPDNGANWEILTTEKPARSCLCSSWSLRRGRTDRSRALPGPATSSSMSSRETCRWSWTARSSSSCRGTASISRPRSRSRCSNLGDGTVPGLLGRLAPLHPLGRFRHDQDGVKR